MYRASEESFLYRYDFGDNWEHVITVEHVSDDRENDFQGGAWITNGGGRACPTEDVGGTDGYHEFLETLLTEPHSLEGQRLREWAGGEFNPQQFDKRLANAAILRMLYNGWGGK